MINARILKTQDTSVVDDLARHRRAVQEFVDTVQESLPSAYHVGDNIPIQKSSANHSLRVFVQVDGVLELNFAHDTWDPLVHVHAGEFKDTRSATGLSVEQRAVGQLAAQKEVLQQQHQVDGETVTRMINQKILAALRRNGIEVFGELEVLGEDVGDPA